MRPVGAPVLQPPDRPNGLVMRGWLVACWESEEGATALEYAIVAGFIAAACAVAVRLLGQSVPGLFVVSC